MIKRQLLAFADALDEKAKLLDAAIESGEVEEREASAAGIVVAALIAESIRDVWGRQN